MGSVAKARPPLETDFVADSGSFRDRNNRVYDNGTAIVRGISEDAAANWELLCQEPFYQALVDAGKIIQTEHAESALVRPGQWPRHLKHARIPFISYPYEWSFGMLKDAALLTLDILESAHESGWTLKDATAYNIQFIAAKPVFIDIPSFVPHAEGDPWVGYRQFCMQFLYPLMFQAYKGIDFQPFLRGNIEGIDPLVANKVIGNLAIFKKGVLSHVKLHASMQERSFRAQLSEAQRLTEDANQVPTEHKKLHHSKAMVVGTLQGLRRTINALSSGEEPTTWSAYDTTHSYSDSSFDVKRDFVSRVSAKKHRQLVWDLGCNTGTFSRICSDNADYVVAVDGDVKAIDHLYYGLKSAAAGNILPLTLNLANPSPGQGWLSGERKAFVNRGKPDLILCLALIHHIVISANIPLAEFLQWLRSFNSEIVIEFVSVEDAMSKMLLRGRVNQYGEMTEAEFETIASSIFTIESSQSLKGSHRKLYHLTPQ
ncbi:methyltransferase domain-containing protein [Aliihoeflea sp. PC F10.4]